MVPTRRPATRGSHTGSTRRTTGVLQSHHTANLAARIAGVALAAGVASCLTACGQTTETTAPPGPTASSQSAQGAPSATPTLDTTDPAALTKALEDAVAAQKTVHVSGPITQREQDMTVTADLRGLADPDLTATVKLEGAPPSHITVKDGTFYLDIGPHLNNRYLIVKPGSGSSPLGEGYGGFVDQINPLTLTKALRSARAVEPVEGVATLGGEPVSGYRLTVTREGMKTILSAQVGTAALPLLPKTFDVTVLVGQDGLLRRASWDVKGAAAKLTYAKWGEKVVVTVPPDPVEEHVLVP